ncbi:response regulator [Gillisia sp. M10.2A]|uniref:Response regulator n=1 Tax=Gillisia lutea TaxID=2909668 RepID=A0ABS9EGJ6_9FLAO|nr:response regulator [Gillisia lutea]MCF4101259.1 response regulator [Gillisia lutea]
MSKPFIVCIIDDDEVYQFTVTRSINAQKLAKKILVFSDGELALQFLSDNIADNENVPDVIFVDINMPVMDGWEFLEEYVNLKPRLTKQITLYMVSSSVDPVDLDRAKKISEISDYIIKPVTPDAIKEIIVALEEKSKVEQK